MKVRVRFSNFLIIFWVFFFHRDTTTIPEIIQIIGRMIPKNILKLNLSGRNLYKIKNKSD
jgi:hypothetical protein